MQETDQRRVHLGGERRILLASVPTILANWDDGTRILSNSVFNKIVTDQRMEADESYHSFHSLSVCLSVYQVEELAVANWQGKRPVSQASNWCACDDDTHQMLLKVAYEAWTDLTHDQTTKLHSATRSLNFLFSSLEYSLFWELTSYKGEILMWNNPSPDNCIFTVTIIS